MTPRIWTLAEVEKLQHWKFPGGYSAHATRQGFRFNAARARRFVNFGAKYFKHTKGALGGQPLNAEPHQAAFFANLMGWEDPRTGLRRYRSAYREIARGNGKSTECVVIVGGLLYLDDEPGAEVVSAAGTRDQAHEVFRPFRHNVLSNPALEAVSQCYQNSVVHIDAKTGLPAGSYKAIAADANTQFGGSPHGIIFDELHVQPNRELWDALHTGKIKRSQPLTVAITTAGWDRNSICYEQRQYAEKVRDGIFDDPTFFPTIYAADAGDDWTAPATWRKANPNLGVSIFEKDLAAECLKAQQLPLYENAFKRLHLNLWTSQENVYLDMDAWDECAEDLPPLGGQPCFAGLDLSATQDLTAIALVFPMESTTGDVFAVLPHFWIPEATAAAKEKSDRVPYQQWAREGFVTMTPGNQVDHAFVMDYLRRAREAYQLQEVAFDRWGATNISNFLEREGFKRAAFGQGFASMSGPTKELQMLVGQKRIIHGGNPVLRWNASNATARFDEAENVKPIKSRSTGRIDGVVALITALGRALSAGVAPSYYDGNALEIG